ncbi:hypothetical protein SDC9_95658 [bioreactor metagenome]|uniref:Uncharacterized protein n=1 Tax=bioreactor metagenome TaxID=1076179 RepID=A0A645A9G9_9ZZZZ
MHGPKGLESQYQDQGDQKDSKPLVGEQQAKDSLVTAVESLECSFSLIVDEAKQTDFQRLLLTGVNAYITAGKHRDEGD